ncbi:TPA: hypothetical protein DCW38_06865 [candidate division WOR-3 bacterium]|jgi:hypothetical protein|uniref:Uncharacterized protein n=1 Tax=candidate division WOR-3 bacterium TaxID=2052148 RepID=A0A350HBG9_UNCW3|nr:hypothetical protein [candidate division WOR-3 bacterium]
MYFAVIFVVFLAVLVFVSFKTKDAQSFLSLASFISGITQMVMLFVLFLAIFTGVRKSEFTMNTSEMIVMYMLDFAAILIFLVLVFIRLRTEKKQMDNMTIVKELVQLFLPVLILNLSIRILSSFDLGEHNYVYIRLVNQYLYALFFKLIFSLSALFLAKTLNSYEKGKDE